MNASYAAYGSIGYSLAIIGIPLYIYMPTFYSQEVGLSVGIVGGILLSARLIDMMIDPLIGYRSDKTYHRYEGRKPYLVAGVICLLLGYAALVNPPESIWASIWLFVFSLLMYIGWSLISVPYLAISSEMTLDYHQKTALSSYREVFSILGMLSALLIPYVMGISDQAGRTLEILLYLLCFTFPLALVWFVKKVQTIKKPSVSVSFLRGLSLLIHDRAKYLMGAYTLNTLSNAIPSTLFLYYISLVLDAKEESGLFLILYFISGIAALPFWLWLSKTYSKKAVWSASMLFASAAFGYVPFLAQGDLYLYGAIVIASGFSLGADLVFSTSLQADLAQSYVRENTPMNGVLFGLWGMQTKFSLALGVGISFGILELVGFDPASPSADSLATLSWLYGAAPVILKLLSITLLSRYRE